MKVLFLIYLVLLILIENVKCARILGIFPFPSKSHSILGQALCKELVNRDHQVTFVSMYSTEEPPDDYEEIILTEYGIMESFNNGKLDSLSTNIMRDRAIQELLRDKSRQFDLVILDLMWNEALLGFGPHYNAPVIVMASIGHIRYINSALHSPISLSIFPHPFLGYHKEHMSLMHRIENIVTFRREDFEYYDTYSIQAELYLKNFNTNITLDQALENSVSLGFVNTHFSINFPAPYAPNIIEIGGFHIKQTPGTLPENILEFIESAEHGVIYFSLGGNVYTSEFDDNTLQTLTNVFSKVKQKVIMKWDEKLDLDENKFLVSKWLPQEDILAHNKTKLFITHGGMLSIIEALVHEVPIVGIPTMGDQLSNVDKACLQGWGVRVNFKSMTEENLSAAIDEILGNKMYHINAKRTSRRFKDQPQTPMERAIYWTEYIIRHKGADFIKSPVRSFSVIEYYNLDAYFCVISVVVIYLAVFWQFIYYGGYFIYKIISTIVHCQDKDEEKVKAS